MKTAHELPEEDDSILRFERLFGESPTLPAIGSLLELMEEAGEIYGKANDAGRGRRTLVQRYAAEEKVDFDRFGRALDDLFEGWNGRLSGLGNHWLDPSRWNQAIGAYAELARNVSVLGAGADTIATFIAYTVASWFAIGLFRWTRDRRNRVDRIYAADLLWFLPADGRGTPYAAIFDDLKDRFDIDGTRFHALANRLAAGEDDAVRDELARSIERWSSGETVPRLETLIDAVEKRLIASERSAEAKEFRSASIAVSFGRALIAWAARIGCRDPYPVIRGAMAGTLKSLLKGESDLTFIPSPRFLNGTDSYFRTTVQLRFWEGIQDREESGRAVQETTLVAGIVSGIAAQVEDHESGLVEPDDLLRAADVLRYRMGSGYAALEEFALTAAVLLRDERTAKELHSRRVLERMTLTPCARSANWRRYVDDLVREGRGPFSHLDSKEALAWAAEYRKGRIDQWRTWGRYLRTRLMIASGYGDVDLVERLLRDGADPRLVSVDRGASYGDGATALLLSLQGYRDADEPLHPGSRSESRSIAVSLIARIGRDPETLSRGSFIRNECPLGAAIESGDAELVALLVENGADMEEGIGGDEMTALYSAISDYLRAAIAERRGSEGFVDWMRTNGAEVNTARMAVAPPFASLAPGYESSAAFLGKMPLAMLDFMKRKASEIFSFRPDKIKEARRTIEVLLDAGADPDKLQSNGRYPLDLADEIERETGDPSIRDLLELRGAVKRAI